MNSDNFRLVIYFKDKSRIARMILYYATDFEVKMAIQLLVKGLRVDYQIDKEFFDGDDWVYMDGIVSGESEKG